MILKHLRELYRYRALLYIFVYRDIKARYKHTALGITWAVIQPLFLMFIFTLVFSFFFKVSSGGIPYPVFSYVALLPWTFLSRVISASGIHFIGSRGLLTRIYFPREIIPLSTVLSSLVDFSIASVIFVFMLLYYQIPINASLVFLPILLLILILFVSGLALFSSVAMALFRDLEFAMPLAIQLWMYASPVIYSIHNLQPSYRILFYFNPAAGIIEGFRDTIIVGRMPHLGYLGTSALFSVLIFFAGYWAFKRLEHLLVDIM